MSDTVSVARDRRMAVVVLIGACVLAAIVSSRGSNGACVPVEFADGGVVYFCAPGR